MYIDILSKILLGVALAAPIGPVSVEMIKRGIRNGFLSAFIVRLGAAIGNLACLIVAYYGLLKLKEANFIIIGLSLISSLILIHKALMSITSRESVADFSLQQDSNTNGILTGLYLSVANPIAFIFWSGIITNSAGAFDSGLIFNSLIILGVIIWGAIFSLLLSVGKNHATPSILILINKISGLIMLYYGLKFLWLSLSKVFTL